MPLEPTKHVNGRMWPPGLGNPNGRPVGSRTAFSQGFLKDLAEVWAERGKETMLHPLRRSRPRSLLTALISSCCFGHFSLGCKASRACARWCRFPTKPMRMPEGAFANRSELISRARWSDQPDRSCSRNAWREGLQPFASEPSSSSCRIADCLRIPAIVISRSRRW